jgi:hypothetical protein
VSAWVALCILTVLLQTSRRATGVAVTSPVPPGTGAESSGSAGQAEDRRESHSEEPSGQQDDNENRDKKPSAGDDRESPHAAKEKAVGPKEDNEPKKSPSDGDRENPNQGNEKAESAKPERERTPVDPMADATVQGPFSYDAFIIPRTVARLMLTNPEKTISEHGGPASPSQMAAIRAKDEDSLHEGMYHLFRVPNRGPLTVEWTGRADGSGQVLLSQWDGSRFMFGGAKDASRNTSFTVTLSRPESEKYLYVLAVCPRGQLYTDAFVCLPAKAMDEGPVAEMPGRADRKKASSREEGMEDSEQIQKKDLLRSAPIVRMPPLADQRPAAPRENERKAVTESLLRTHAALFRQIGKRQTSPEDRAELARQLYQLGLAERDELPKRFVLLNLAGQHAVLSGNGVLALQAAEDITVQFLGESLKVKLQSLDLLARGYRGRKYASEDNKEREKKRAAAIAGALVAFVEEAMGQRDYDAAQRACKLAADFGFDEWGKKDRERLAVLSRMVEKAAAQPEAAIPDFYPPHRVGYWNPSSVEVVAKILLWDLTPFITLPGQYSIWFQCGNGGDALEVEWVVLGQGGKEISRHLKDSAAESGGVSEQYTLAIESPEPGRQYGLYALVKAAGRASHGCVRMKYMGPTGAAPSAPGPSGGRR